MSYKSIPLTEVITQFNQEIPEIKTINEIELLHSDRNIKPDYLRPLVNHIRFLPLTNVEIGDKTIDETILQKTTYELQILKVNALPVPIVKSLRSKVNTLVFVDSFS